MTPEELLKVRQANAIRPMLLPIIRPLCTDGFMYNLVPRMNGALMVLGTKSSPDGAHSITARREITPTEIANNTYQERVKTLLDELRVELNDPATLTKPTDSE